MSGCLCVRRKTSDVYSLDYRHSNLDYIPSDVFRHERTLEELYIDANQIKELPRELFCCHELKKLSVSDNEIRSIPPAIASLIHLEELDIGKNGLVNIPDNIKFCKCMRRIEASVNPLGKLPEGFTQLDRLTELYLNDAFLDYLPGNFGRLSKLKVLEIRENHFKTLPRSMSHMSLLQRLDIGNNDFTELPDVIGSLPSLLELWCDSNQLTSIPPCVGNLRLLIFLDGSKNRIETIPAEIEGCVALGDLHLSTNMLQQLPETLGRLSNLTTLKLDDNRLTCLPYSIGGLASLSELNVSGNDLEGIPPSIGLLRHLRTMYSDENFIHAIPAELGSCSGLTVLSLRGNNLSKVPEEIGRIPRLRVLNLSDNKIQSLPYSLTRLKELQALWLAENQTKPLIKLQSDLNTETGQRSLTCYLLPQQPRDDKDDMHSENGSFHPSLWEEERAQRQQIHFEGENIEDAEGKLRRQPTPYPKEMKHRIEHMRNLALKELNVPNIDRTAQGVSTQQDPQQQGDKVIGRRDSPVKASAGTSTASASSLSGERHTLLKADKEKLQRDKARMQGPTLHNVSHQYATINSPGRDVDDGGFLDSSQRHGPASHHNTSLPRSASLDRSVSGAGLLHGPESKSSPDVTRAKTSSQRHTRNSASYNDFLQGLASHGIQVTDDMQPGSIRSIPTSGSHRHSGHSHHSHHHNYHPMPRPKSRNSGNDSDIGYKSDVGYRSEAGYRSDAGYRSEAGCRSDYGYRRSGGHNKYDRVPSGYASDGGRRSSNHRHSREPGYTSDYEPYSRGTRKHNSSYQGYPGEHHRHGHRGHNQVVTQNNIRHQPQSYSTVSISKRTTIRNDEMYETSNHASRPPVVRSRSAGDDLLISQTEESHHGSSLQVSHRSRSQQESLNGDAHSTGNRTPRNEQKNGELRDNKEQYSGDLYNSIGTLEKSPGSGRRSKQEECLEEERQDHRSSQHVGTPPYHPTPPYPTPQSASQHSLHDDPQAALGTPHSQPLGDTTTTNGPTSSIRTPNHRERSPGYGSDRPNTLPLGDSRSPHIRKQLYQQANSGPESKTELSVNTDCGTLDSNHNTPSKSWSTPTPGGTPATRGPVGAGSTTGPQGRAQGPGPPPATPQGQGRTPQRGQSPWNGNYDQEVAVYKQMEPPSQVSSSTDSGYGHAHLYDRTPADPNRSSVSSGQPSPAGPNQGHYKQVFQVTLVKNPGLGFSIAGGVGSPGNPFRSNDLGIFITRVQPDGPGTGILKAADKILEVNGLSFQKLEHSRAVDALRNSSQTVSMVIERLQMSHNL